MNKVLVCIFTCFLFYPSFGATHNPSENPVSKNQYSLELNQLLKNHHSFQADFSQQLIQEKRPPQSSSGVIQLKRPGMFIWQVNQPFPQKLISDGKTIWQYDPDLEQVVIKAVKSNQAGMDLVQFIESPEKINQRFQITQFKVNNNSEKIFVLNAIKASEVIREMTLTFTANKLKKITYVNAMQQQINLIFNSIKLNELIPNERFVFIPPKNTETIYEK